MVLISFLEEILHSAHVSYIDQLHNITLSLQPITITVG